MESVVRKLVVIGTCVEKPNRLAAVTPVGIITALSLLANRSGVFLPRKADGEGVEASGGA